MQVRVCDVYDSYKSLNSQIEYCGAFQTCNKLSNYWDTKPEIVERCSKFGNFAQTQKVFCAGEGGSSYKVFTHVPRLTGRLVLRKSMIN